jgi:hypothetical protein
LSSSRTRLLSVSLTAGSGTPCLICRSGLPNSLKAWFFLILAKSVVAINGLIWDPATQRDCSLRSPIGGPCSLLAFILAHQIVFGPLRAQPQTAIIGQETHAWAHKQSPGQDG